MAEKQNIEYKESWSDDYLKWVCGFANAHGGKIFIGIDNAGIISGVEKSHKLMTDIPNKIKNTMGIISEISLHGTIGNEYIEIDVQPYPVAISYKGVYYRRSGATNQQLTGYELESFLLRRRGANWESSPLPGLTMGDIEDNEIDYFLEKALEKGRIHEGAENESKEVLIDKLHLIRTGYLTNAAALLFTKDPERWFTGAFIKVGYFENDAEIIYHDEVRGSLLRQIDIATELIYFKYLKAKISYKGTQRIERYPFPNAAIREALLNAIIHKQYESGIPIQVSVYDDKLYIANIGRIPEDWTIDNLLGKHASRPYNPNVANVFYLGGFIESWGRGVEKIFNACIDDGVPVPTYTIHPGDIMIKFDAPEDRIIWRNKPNKVIYESKFNSNGDDEPINEIINEQLNDATDKLPKVVAEKLPNNIKVAEKLPNNIIGELTSAELSFLHDILDLLDKNEWISNSDVRGVTGKSDGSVKRFMRNLKDKNALESRGETKDRQYRLPKNE